MVYLPLWNYEFVSWDDKNPNCFWKVIKFHGSKPPIRYCCHGYPRVHGSNPGFLPCLAGSRMVDQLFWCEQKGTWVLIHGHLVIFFISVWCHISLQFPMTLYYMYIYIIIYTYTVICVCICGSILSNPNCLMPKSFLVLGETPDFGEKTFTVACSQ